MAKKKQNDFVKLKDEKDSKKRLVKVRAIVYEPDGNGDVHGICERITYNKEGMPIRWEYPPIKNMEIVQRTSGGKKVKVLAKIKK